MRVLLLCCSVKEVPAGTHAVRGRSPPRQALGDLLEELAVAVRIAERGERAVALTVWGQAGDSSLSSGAVEHPAGVVEHLAHLGAASGELGPGRVDVGDDEV